MLITLERGSFDREMAAIEHATTATNDYSPQHPLSSFAGFVEAWYSSCPIFASISPAREKAIEHLMFMLMQQTLPSIDSSLANSDTADDNDFNIPSESDGSSGAFAIWRRAVCFSGYFFQFGTWPWTIYHEGILSVSGGSPFANAELQRIASSDDTGPIGMACVAAALEPIDPSDARLVAKLGLERLTPDKFNRDFRVLFQSEGIASKALSHLLQAIAELDETDFATLTTVFPGDWAEAAKYIRQIARENPNRPVADVLSENTSQFWDHGIQKIVETQLKRESETPDPATQPNP